MQYIINCLNTDSNDHDVDTRGQKLFTIYLLTYLVP